MVALDNIIPECEDENAHIYVMYMKIYVLQTFTIPFFLDRPETKVAIMPVIQISEQKRTRKERMKNDCEKFVANEGVAKNYDKAYKVAEAIAQRQSDGLLP